jgi:hypothetical protein
MPHLVGSASLGHNHALPPLGFSVEKLVSTHTHRWNRNLKVTRTHTHKWNRVILVVGSPKTKTHKYTIRKRVLVQKTHRFNSGGRVKKSKKHLFSIRKKVSKTKTHKFSIKKKVTKSKTHKWNTVGRIIRTHIHKWNAGGRLFPRPTKTHKYDIKKKITRTHTHKWNILTPVIISTELQYYKSTNSNSTGGAIDTNAAIVHNTEHNLFDVVAASESSTGDTEYRCLYVKNISSRSVLQNSKIWIYANTPSTFSDVTIGLGTSAISGTEQTIANEGTAPAGVSFTTADGMSNALSIGNLIAGQHKAVWVKRVINAASLAYDNDNFTLAFAGDTVASN